MRNTVIVALALSLAAFAFTGCKSPAEKACANLAEVGEKFGESPDDGEMDECVEKMSEVNEECSNGDEVLECLADLDAEDEEEFMKELFGCMGKCEEK